ncbi:MAG: sigma-70 family RNA polymerase sigma factor [Acidobacteria bacterium]|nr:sigma-70 family RNA polymerase sigma factor [Acidobacteriota bacterium]
MMDPSDSELIERTLKGDEGAFAELVRRYQSVVWGTVHRVLGNSSENEDAVQEVFLRAFGALGKFDRRYPFGPWVARIATNYCIDQLRRKRSRKVQLWSELREHEQERLLRDLSMERSPAAAGPGVEDSEGYARVARALLDGLNPKYRAAFILREVEDKDYGEVAATLGTSEVAARVRVSRARAELQKRFRAYLRGCGAKEQER